MSLPSAVRRIGLRRIGLNVISSVFWMLFLPQAHAANVQVAWPSGGPGAYPSISAALSAPNPNDANTITGSGSCSENISIRNFEQISPPLLLVCVYVGPETTIPCEEG